MPAVTARTAPIAATFHPGGRALTACALLAVSVACTVAACRPPATLTQLMDARRQAASLGAHFAEAEEAANRAVMAESDDASTEAVQTARRARQAVSQDVTALRSLLQTLGYSYELEYLDGFSAAFAEYERVDDEILSLAVENSNVKAQRLAFGAAQETASAFRAALDAALHADPLPRDRDSAEALLLKAYASVLEIQALLPPHIAEIDNASMSRMETQISASADAARKALAGLKAVLPVTAAGQLRAADGALDRYMSLKDEIIVLSRRNSDVYSLALTLGKKRTVTARCRDQQRALEEALGMRGSSAATR